MALPGPVGTFLSPICLAGPTGCGKTAAALAIAEVLPVEIISVDSALVYRGMDIGTAKPTAAELAAVPHHLIDILAPTDSYSAAEFVRDARRLAAEISARGRLPLLVGGTMLYFKALFDGLSTLPQADAELRAALDAEAAERGWPAMHAELARLDPATADRLAPNDSQRIQRALEVIRLTGQPLSALHAASRDEGVDWPLFSLEPTDRAWLHERLAQRFDAMLNQGLVDEVKALRARGDLSLALPSMRCVGYRQVWEALDGNDFSTLRERGIAATRQLAKRQVTWLRSMPRRRVIACDGPQPIPELLAGLQRLMA
ncbi:tRNA (adenosine(37)-N6)-dimethylallyltransferase MiaA [Pelomonas puraquae]|uniref:tRNA dimethylallyltransferase n=1 Tax=Roseateles puraquae TaxID=431059 RepID=A0A254N2F2_9BURK|nr:tRNA (adenosine(37)-N6)-dimethylallyltransferase MiaA [Roseateles puraquae]OWR02356.1 tRNA (adenosine(37)-N6)-dimethylallyltransferase MiaA [Roseateles puraquae]